MEEENKTNGGYEAEGNALIGYIRGRFQQAETSKVYDEKRWLKAYRNYRGLYGPETAFRENEKSRVFVKITKTKVLASFGQIIEVLFSQGKFPLGVSPTSVPEDISKRAHLDPKNPEQPQEELESPYGFPGDGAQIPPGATVSEIMKNLNQEYENLGFKDGPSYTGSPQIEPARMAAEQMQKLMHDQLEESRAITIMRHVFFEMALMGTGILKGPFTDTKEYHAFSTSCLLYTSPSPRDS